MKIVTAPDQKVQVLRLMQTSQVNGILSFCQDECVLFKISEEGEGVMELNCIIVKLTNAKVLNIAQMMQTRE